MSGRGDGILRAFVAVVAVAAATLAVAGSRAAERDALVVSGDGSSLTGVARADVERVLIVRMDGVEEELEVAPDGTFAYAAESPDRAARSLTARSDSSAVLSTIVLTPAPACGGTAGPCPQATAASGSPHYALFARQDKTVLTRIDPRTLGPVGPTLALEGYRWGTVRSPDGARMAVSAPDRAAIDLVDLERLQVLGRIEVTRGERTSVRGLAWLRDDRLLAVVQQMSAPYSRFVESRELVVLNPQTRRVVSRSVLTNKLAVHGFAAEGGRLVLLLQPSTQKGSTVQLVVADAEGAVRTTTLEVGRYHSSLRGNVLVVEPGGKLAFVFLRAPGSDGARAIEVDLDTLRRTQRLIRRAPGTRLLRIGASSLQAIAAGNGHVVATDVVDARGELPASGVFLIDTRTWVARLLDARARGLGYHDGKVFTFGANNLVRVDASGTVSPPRGGTGIAAYDLSGRQLYHVYGERPFERLLFAGTAGHGLPSGKRSRVAFDTASGRGLATLPPLASLPIEVVPDPPRASRSTAAAPAGEFRAFDRKAIAADRLPELVSRSFRQHGPRLLESRQVARYVDGRGRLYRLFVARGRDAKGGSETCQILVQAGGTSSGCSPSGEFLAAGRRVAASRGRLMSGIAAREVTRVVIVGTQGRLHPVRLTTDGGFIWNCGAYNGCVCVVSELRAYDRTGRLVTRQDWRSGSCKRRAESSARRAASGYTIGNRGREVAPRQVHGPLFDGHTYKLFLLGTLNGSAFYRVQVTPRYTCWGTGKSSRIGEVGTLGCPTLVGAYPLQLEGTALIGKAGSKVVEYQRINGIAVDQAATMALIGERGNRVATMPVENNLFAFLPPYPEAYVRAVALDVRGKELKPHPERGERQTAPPNLWGPQVRRVAQARLTEPIQRGEARGVTLRVGANGVVVLDGKAIAPRARKLLSGRQVGVKCFVLTANHRQTRSTGFSDDWQPKFAFRIVGLKPPFDGCDLQGSYGHRWRDQYGTHSAVEIALTARARRYFANRAAARDLALFVRSGKTQQLRKQTGAALIAALRNAYGDSVTVLATRTAKAPVGEAGVWASGSRTVFSEQSSTGVRYFVELTNGKITKETVRGLAFVF